MEVGNRRKSTSSRNNGSVVASGSVWENRMKLDEVKGGIKVLISNNIEETPDENDDKDCTFTNGNNNQVDKKLEMGPKKSNLGVVGVMSGKRKTWKAENFEGNPIQIASKRTDLSKKLDEKCQDLSKKLDEKCQDLSKIPIRSKKKSESVNGKAKLVSSKEFDEESKNLDSKILKKSNLEESSKNIEGSIKENEKKPLIGIKKTKSEENCEEKFITSNVVNLTYDEEVSSAILDRQVRKLRSREITSEAKFVTKVDKNLENEEEEEEWDEVLEEEIDEEIEKKSVDVKEIRVQEQKPKKIVIEEKKLQYNNKRQIPISSINRKQLPPTSIHAKIHPSPTRTKSVPVSDVNPRQNGKLQSFVDLVMWRNVSKSTLVFGIGTFVIISSSYTQDLNISFIAVLSYLGLVYLAAIFLFRSLIHRRANDIGESSEYIVGEEEAVWALKLILPFINEFLLKIRALFSGDPATTMKMAVLLFLLARYGSSITIWKLSKLGFFGVMVIPKTCSSYSTQLTSYGTFLIRYIRDAWESCTHKKAVGFAIFTIVWNFSSIIARTWAVFMLYVGIRYYQQNLMTEDITIKADDSWQGKIREQRQVGRKSSLMETRKQKKAF
ncbi:reticulon-like protein B21 [Nicotiana sylvestris]|uniref:Reticulon-like protein n=1 Tax=Nicotiana sylvestris TaxID=4096 RepID=A0A1U7XVZ3_NICSY|nr:PREDICTED: reticulon-like protein B21 [Nicotiana sylvestris]